MIDCYLTSLISYFRETFLSIHVAAVIVEDIIANH